MDKLTINVGLSANGSAFGRPENRNLSSPVSIRSQFESRITNGVAGADPNYADVAAGFGIQQNLAAGGTFVIDLLSIEDLLVQTRAFARVLTFVFVHAANSPATQLVLGGGSSNAIFFGVNLASATLTVPRGSFLAFHSPTTAAVSLPTSSNRLVRVFNPTTNPALFEFGVAGAD